MGGAAGRAEKRDANKRPSGTVRQQIRYPCGTSCSPKPSAQSPGRSLAPSSPSVCLASVALLFQPVGSGMASVRPGAFAQSPASIRRCSDASPRQHCAVMDPRPSPMRTLACRSRTAAVGARCPWFAILALVRRPSACVSTSSCAISCVAVRRTRGRSSPGLRLRDWLLHPASGRLV